MHCSMDRRRKARIVPVSVMLLTQSRCSLAGMLRDRRPILAALALTAVLATGPGDRVDAADIVPGPPEIEVFVSPSGAYRLRLLAPRTLDGGSPVAELRRRESGGERHLWRRALPHVWRPRLALVDDAGRILLLDEWLNTKSRLAVMILTPEGEETAVHDFEAVREALAEPVRVVVARAEHGWWIAGAPRLADDAPLVVVPAAGKHLAIDLATGALSSRP